MPENWLHLNNLLAPRYRCTFHQKKATEKKKKKTPVKDGGQVEDLSYGAEIND